MPATRRRTVTVRRGPSPTQRKLERQLGDARSKLRVLRGKAKGKGGILAKTAAVSAGGALSGTLVGVIGQEEVMDVDTRLVMGVATVAVAAFVVDDKEWSEYLALFGAGMLAAGLSDTAAGLLGAQES